MSTSTEPAALAQQLAVLLRLENPARRHVLDAAGELSRQHAEIERLEAERDAMRAASTELLACLIEARDDVAAELQRCSDAAGYPSTDRRLKYQEDLLERVDAAIRAAQAGAVSSAELGGWLRCARLVTW